VIAVLLLAAQIVAPADFRVRLDTSRGPIVIAVHRAWAPRGADRFYELVTSHCFDDTRFFRVVRGQWAQFGINGNPKVATAWRTKTIPDDPRGQAVTRGRVAFAFKDPNGRTTQIYIALRDLPDHVEQGFVPFGEVVEGMDVVKKSGAVPTGRQDRPVTPVTIKKLTIERVP